jgi:hypothetical protein
MERNENQLLGKSKNKTQRQIRNEEEGKHILAIDKTQR